ncbi:ATPase, T2SS/T4P/T4SS family [Pelistega indica]|uniref:ATPase, T2SS/T4P/T4SS family n=1 Tax=Pelistega indica TaxID=1414851 RepID=UPI00040A2D9B|nr:ATPase, T2SS/T4P/T4SS family [Pelistega indica]
MKVELLYEDGHSSIEYIAIPFKVGKTKEMDLVLKSWRVSKHHATFIQKEGDYYVEDHGSLSGTLLNGNRIAIGGPLKRQDEIIIGPCLIKILEIEEPESPDEDVQIIPPTDRLKEFIQPHFVDAEKVINAQYLQHHQRLHIALLEALELRKRDIATLSDSALRVDADKLLSRIIEEDTELDEQIDRQVLKQIILDEAVGLGALEPLLKDQSITEIMVNKFDEIYIERAGKLMQSQATFSSEKAVLSIIERIVSPIGRRIDESSPMVDARLADGSRVNAIIPPIALKGASLTIRKFTQHRPQIAELIQLGALDNCMAEFLQLCIEHKKKCHCFRRYRIWKDNIT